MKTQKTGTGGTSRLAREIRAAGGLKNVSRFLSAFEAVLASGQSVAGWRMEWPGVGVWRWAARRGRWVSLRGQRHWLPPRRVLAFRASTKKRVAS